MLNCISGLISHPEFFFDKSIYKIFIASVLAESQSAQIFGRNVETDINGEIFSLLAAAAQDVTKIFPKDDSDAVFKVGYSPMSHVEPSEGGEIAVIIHGKFGHDCTESFRPILFQAKRSSSQTTCSVRRDNKCGPQIFRLIANGHGYYLFYPQHARTEKTSRGRVRVLSGPTVRTSHSVLKEILPKSPTTMDEWNWRVKFDGENSIALSIFIAFDCFNKKSSFKSYETGSEALSAMLKDSAPSELVYLAAGEGLNVARFLSDAESLTGVDFAQNGIGNIDPTDKIVARFRSPSQPRDPMS